MSKGSKRKGWKYQRNIRNHIGRDLQKQAYEGKIQQLRSVIRFVVQVASMRLTGCNCPECRKDLAAIESSLKALEMPFNPKRKVVIGCESMGFQTLEKAKANLNAATKQYIAASIQAESDLQEAARTIHENAFRSTSALAVT